jgi:hypothetical protein
MDHLASPAGKTGSEERNGPPTEDLSQGRRPVCQQVGRRLVAAAASCSRPSVTMAYAALCGACLGEHMPPGIDGSSRPRHDDHAPAHHAVREPAHFKESHSPSATAASNEGLRYSV